MRREFCVAFGLEKQLLELAEDTLTKDKSTNSPTQTAPKYLNTALLEGLWMIDLNSQVIKGHSGVLIQDPM